MAKRKHKSYKRPGSTVHHRKNTGRKMNTGHAERSVRRYRRNAGSMGSAGSLVTTGTFALVGALGSKIGAQLVLGSNNTGIFGYGGNLVAGAALWFLAEKGLKNRTAANGIAIGTVIQVILRAINDFTPFGTYVANLGMGDYQAQSYVTPQILIDPVTSADIRIPNGWGAPAALPMAAAAPASGKGMGGSVYDNWGGTGGSYAL